MFRGFAGKPTETAGWTAIFAPASLSRDEVERRLPPAFAGVATGDCVVRFSVNGTSLDLDDPNSDKLHVLTGLDARFKRAAILSDAPSLYATEAVYCWLANLLRDMGAGGQLWLQIADSRADRRNGRITRRDLAHRFAGFTVVKAGPWNVVKYQSDTAPELPPAQTIYRFLHRGYKEFISWYIPDFYQTRQLRSEQAAVNVYIYSLFGIFYRDFLVERICQSHDLRGGKRLLDVGGGPGFFAAERAAHGDQVTILDKNPRYLGIARRLFKHCRVAERISILQMPMESLDHVSETYDVITFFNSLYYADRAAVAAVLHAAFTLLNPGGVIVLLENPKGAGDMTPENYEYDVAFSLPDLLRLVEPFGDRVAYWHLMTGTQIDIPRRPAQMAVSISRPG